MNLPSPGSILVCVPQQFRSQSRYSAKDSHTHGKIRAPNEACASARNRLRDLLEAIEPAGGPSPGGNPRPREALQIFRSSFRRGEFNGDINVMERFRGDAAAVCIVSFIQK